MKKFMIVAAACVAIFSACGNGGGRIKSDVDSMSYMYGVHIGRNLWMQDSTTNANLVAKGIIDVFNKKTDITVDSAGAYLQNYFMVVMPKKKEAAEKVYLESVEKNHPGIKKTESGLLYEIVEAGDTNMMPTDSDQVKVNYVGRFREGAEYDAKKQGKEFDKNDSLDFSLTQVVPGWSEGLKLIGKGGKIRLWIPSAIGYGKDGNAMWGGPVGPYETLVFDVDLLDVMPVAPAAPAADAAAAGTATAN